MATQHAVMDAGSLARNPTTSPIILHPRCRRRRKTLRTLLGHPPSNRPPRFPELSHSFPLNDGTGDNTDDITSGGVDGKGGARVRHKWKDLLISTSLKREEDEVGDKDMNEGRRADMRAMLLGKSGIGGGVTNGMRRLRLVETLSMGLGLGEDMKSRKLRRRRLMVSLERRETLVRRERREKASRVWAEESNKESRPGKVSLPRPTSGSMSGPTMSLFPNEGWTDWLDQPAKLARGERRVREGESEG